MIWVLVAFVACSGVFYGSLRLVDNVRERRYRRRARYDARRQARYRAWVEAYKAGE